MVKFVVMTRGRTGSTAIVDQLNKANSLCVMQELFLTYDFGPDPQLSKEYPYILAFDAWKDKQDFPVKSLFDQYLHEVEEIARNQNCLGVGFKLLSHHLDERDGLKEQLKLRGYKAVYLTRNVAGQVLSGMVANQRGIYNSTSEVEDSKRYAIDLDKFRGLVGWEVKCIENDRQLLKDVGIECCTVTYEEFCENKQAFFERVFNFLGLPIEIPAESDYTVMIKDAAYTIENYDEVVGCAKSMGFSLA